MSAVSPIGGRPPQGRSAPVFAPGEILTPQGPQRFERPLDLLSIILALPSGFSERDARFLPVPPWPPAVSDILTAFSVAYTDPRAMGSEMLSAGTDLAARITHFPDVQARLLGMTALGYAAREDLATGLELARRGLDTAVRHPVFEQEISSTVVLHEVLRAHACVCHRKLDLASYGEAMGEIARLRQRLVHLRRGGFDTTVFPRAWHVGEGEVGVGYGEALGTSNVAQCIALALHHPDSGTQLLTHLQRQSQRRDVVALIRSLRGASPGSEIRARAVGAMRIGLPEFDTEVLEFALALFHDLAHLGIKVESADLFNREQPRSVVLNEGFEFREGFASRSVRSIDLLDAAMLTRVVRPLERGPDLRVGHTGDTTLIMPDLVGVASLGVAPSALAELRYREWVDPSPFPSLAQSIVSVELDIVTNRAVREALQAVADETKRPNAELLEHAMLRGIYAGPGSLAANVKHFSPGLHFPSSF